jgi:hypothetical protein
MVLDVPVAEVLELIGHDGSEIVFPKQPEPYCRRSFHLQELIDVCMLKNTSVVPIEFHPVSEANGQHYVLKTYSIRAPYYLENYNGVLTGLGRAGTPHAVAWNREKIYDPNGSIYSLDDFSIENFYLLIQF